MDITNTKDLLKADNCSCEEETDNLNLGNGKDIVFDYKDIAHLPKPTLSDIDNPMKTTLLWDLITDDNVPFAVIAGVLGVFVCISVIFTFWLFLRRKERYQHLAFREDRLPDHFHKPLDDGLEEQYGNTFSGVSVPLIQDSSKV